VSDEIHNQTRLKPINYQPESSCLEICHLIIDIYVLHPIPIWLGTW